MICPEKHTFVKRLLVGFFAYSVALCPAAYCNAEVNPQDNYKSVARWNGKVRFTVKRTWNADCHVRADWCDKKKTITDESTFAYTITLEEKERLGDIASMKLVDLDIEYEKYTPPESFKHTHDTTAHPMRTRTTETEITFETKERPVFDSETVEAFAPMQNGWIRYEKPTHDLKSQLGKQKRQFSIVLPAPSGMLWPNLLAEMKSTRTESGVSRGNLPLGPYVDNHPPRGLRSLLIPSGVGIQIGRNLFANTDQRWYVDSEKRWVEEKMDGSFTKTKTIPAKEGHFCLTKIECTVEWSLQRADCICKCRWVLQPFQDKPKGGQGSWPTSVAHSDGPHILGATRANGVCLTSTQEKIVFRVPIVVAPRSLPWRVRIPRMGPLCTPPDIQVPDPITSDRKWELRHVGGCEHCEKEIEIEGHLWVNAFANANTTPDGRGYARSNASATSWLTGDGVKTNTLQANAISDDSAKRTVNRGGDVSAGASVQDGKKGLSASGSASANESLSYNTTGADRDPKTLPFHFKVKLDEGDDTFDLTWTSEGKANAQCNMKSEIRHIRSRISYAEASFTTGGEITIKAKCRCQCHGDEVQKYKKTWTFPKHSLGPVQPQR